MKISLAKTAGFCMGVRRAVEMVLDTANRESGPVYTFGPLIHNPQVMGILEEKGVKVLNSVPEKGAGTVVIRAHGVSPEIEENLARAGFKVMDATCPRVIKVQTLVRKHAAKGYTPVIVGDAEHPEVEGLVGHGQGRAVVVRGPEEIDSIPRGAPLVVVAQTTQDVELFAEVCRRIKSSFNDVKIFNTICDSTEKRQAEVAELARNVDAVVIVGGKNSGNTQRLFQVASRSGKPALHVETEKDLDVSALNGSRHVGVTAGASTPTWITRRVCQTLESPPGTGHGLSERLFSIIRALVLTNAYIALGAGCLCLAALALIGREPSFAHVVMAVCYIYSIHTFNNYIGRNAYRYNDPDRALFYEKHRTALLSVSGASLVAGLLAGMLLGKAAFAILLFMTVMGLSYNVPLLPGRLSMKSRYPRIRSIPGSKTLSISLAWGAVTAFLPSLSHNSSPTFFGILAASLFAGGLAFVRAAFFDVLDAQVDRIAGKETLATWLGDEATLALLRRVLMVMSGALAIFSLFGWITSLGYLLLLCVAFPAAMVWAYERGLAHPGYRLEFLMDTNFVLAGALAVLWM